MPSTSMAGHRNIPGLDHISHERHRQLMRDFDDSRPETANGELAECASHIIADYFEDTYAGDDDLVPAWVTDRAARVKEKYGNDYIVRLRIAGALIAAEIDRIRALDEHEQPQVWSHTQIPDTLEVPSARTGIGRAVEHGRLEEMVGTPREEANPLEGTFRQGTLDDLAAGGGEQYILNEASAISYASVRSFVDGRVSDDTARRAVGLTPVGITPYQLSLMRAIEAARRPDSLFVTPSEFIPHLDTPFHPAALQDLVNRRFVVDLEGSYALSHSGRQVLHEEQARHNLRESQIDILRSVLESAAATGQNYVGYARVLDQHINQNRTTALFGATMQDLVNTGRLATRRSSGSTDFVPVISDPENTFGITGLGLTMLRAAGLYQDVSTVVPREADAVAESLSVNQIRFMKAVYEQSDPILSSTTKVAVIDWLNANEHYIQPFDAIVADLIRIGLILEINDPVIHDSFVTSYKITSFGYAVLDHVEDDEEEDSLATRISLTTSAETRSYWKVILTAIEETQSLPGSLASKSDVIDWLNDESVTLRDFDLSVRNLCHYNLIREFGTDDISYMLTSDGSEWLNS